MKKIKRFFRFTILMILIAAGWLVYSGYKKYSNAILEKPLVDAVAQIRETENYTTISNVPGIYIDAVTATEDRRFRYHGGFDIVGTARAIITDIKEKKLVEGGSTITQQLAKNMYFITDNSPERKIAEIFMAFDLEKNYTKDEIFELYMNIIYFGSGYYNIYDAAMGYFQKPPAEMSDFEATLLAGIPNAPSLYSPKVNPDLAYKRQQKVIDCLVDCKYIDAQTAEKILSDSE